MDFSIDPFKITIWVGKQSYTFRAEQTYISPNLEIFTLTYMHREITIQSNRPFIRRDPNSRKKIEWKALNGKAEHREALEQVKLALESHIKSIERPPFDWSTHPKNMPY